MADRFTHGWDEDEKRRKGWRCGTLWCANADVDGEVTLSPEYDDLYPLAKLDLIRDWIGLLEREFDHIQGRWFAELKIIMPEKENEPS